MKSLDPNVSEVLKNPVEPHSSRVGTLSNIRSLEQQLNPPSETVDGVEMTVSTPPSPEERPKIQSQLKQELRHYKQIAPTKIEELTEEQVAALKKRCKLCANAIVQGKPGSASMLTRQEHWEPYQENLAKHRAHEKDITRHALDVEGNWVFIPHEQRNEIFSVAEEFRSLERTLYPDADREDDGWVGEMSTLLPDSKTSSQRQSVSLSGISARDYMETFGDEDLLPGPKRMLDHELNEEKFRCGAETKSGSACRRYVSQAGERCPKHQ